MEIGQIIKENQPGVHKILYKKKKRKRRGTKEHLSFSDIENLMKHDSYERHNGAMRRVR